MADRVPRGPTGIPLLGSSLDFASDPLGFFEECAREYGDCVRVDTVNDEFYLLTDPTGIERVLSKNHENYRKPDFGGEGLDALLGDGLLTSDGETWLRQRRRVQPAFDRTMLDRYAETMVADARSTALDRSPGAPVTRRSSRASRASAAGTRRAVTPVPPPETTTDVSSVTSSFAAATARSNRAVPSDSVAMLALRSTTTTTDSSTVRCSETGTYGAASEAASAAIATN